MAEYEMGEVPEDARSTEEMIGLARWKIILLGLGIIAGFTGGILEGVAYAIGAAMGTGIVYYIVLVLATRVYEKLGEKQPRVIPHRVYRGICLTAGALSILGAFALQTPGNGTFLFLYVILNGLAFIVYGIRQALS